MTAVQDRAAATTREANPAATTADRPIGFGRIQRKEDPRFVRGQGRYVDDIVLPGMLHGAILRSPMAHGRIRGIDSSAARTAPGVIAVVTVDDLGLAGAAVPHVQPEDAAPGVGRPGRSVRR